jgi:AcrR family transcriptional regulator
MVETPRELSTPETLIEATSRRLWDQDESELRILDICQETGLSTSVIYGHFRSRQGLIDAALLRIFTIVTDGIVSNLTTAAEGPHPTGLFIDTLYELLTDPAHQSTITRQRQMFFRVSATSLSRPSIRPGFLELYERYMSKVDDIYDTLVLRNLLGPELTGHQWALFFEGQMLSRAFHDLSSTWDSQEDWNRAARRMLNSEGPAPVG